MFLRSLHTSAASSVIGAHCRSYVLKLASGAALISSTAAAVLQTVEDAMDSIRGRVLCGGTIALAISLAVAGCAEPTEDADVDPAAFASELALEAKPGIGEPTPGASMTCAQATGGCVPVGYRAAYCTLSNLKPNSYVRVCVKAVCPAFYGFSSGYGESCYTTERVAADGTSYAFFTLAPDATYSFTTYSGTKLTTAVASASTTVSSSVGEATQCGGTPAASCF
jgi:hypothetical protein